MTLMKINKYMIEHYEAAFEGLEDHEALAIVDRLKNLAKELVFDAFCKGDMDRFTFHVEAYERYQHAQQVWNILYS
jgi:hypothetical protein